MIVIFPAVYFVLKLEEGGEMRRLARVSRTGFVSFDSASPDISEEEIRREAPRKFPSK